MEYSELHSSAVTAEMFSETCGKWSLQTSHQPEEQDSCQKDVELMHPLSSERAYGRVSPRSLIKQWHHAPCSTETGSDTHKVWFKNRPVFEKDPSIDDQLKHLSIAMNMVEHSDLANSCFSATRQVGGISTTRKKRMFGVKWCFQIRALRKQQWSLRSLCGLTMQCGTNSLISRWNPYKVESRSHKSSVESTQVEQPTWPVNNSYVNPWKSGFATLMPEPLCIESNQIL